MRVPRLVVLTDRHQLPTGLDLVDHLARCADAGLTHVLLRELDLPDDERARLTLRMVRVGLTVWSAHRFLPGAEGVHLPAPDGPHRGENAVPGIRWGRSCHSHEQVTAAARAGATWTTLSPVAPSVSKPGRAALDWSALAGHVIPVLALGGVDEAHAGGLRDAGAHGVAVMGPVMRSTEPEDLTRRLLGAVR